MHKVISRCTVVISRCTVVISRCSVVISRCTVVIIGTPKLKDPYGSNKVMTMLGQEKEAVHKMSC